MERAAFVVTAAPFSARSFWGGHQDAALPRAGQSAGAWVGGSDTLEVHFELMRLQLSRAKIIVFLLSDVESWSFCTISDSKLFSKERWPFPLFSLSVNFSLLLPLAALSSLRRYLLSTRSSRGKVSDWTPVLASLFAGWQCWVNYLRPLSLGCLIC